MTHTEHKDPVQVRQGYKPDLRKILAEAWDEASRVAASATASVCRNPGCGATALPWGDFCSVECYGRGTSYAQSLKRRFGMTLEDYDRMLTAQGGVCAICGEGPTAELPRLNVDHDHVTGTIRGLVCQHCNRGLGGARDNIEILRRMINYLQDHQGVPISLF